MIEEIKKNNNGSNMNKQLSIFLQRWLAFWQLVIENFFKDGCTDKAAVLTFTSLLSVVPLTSVGLTVLSAFPVFNSFAQQVENFIFANFVATSGEIIQTYFLGFVKQTAHLSLFGSIFLLVTAVWIMYTMEGTFNVIWRVREHRKGVSAFMLYWAVLTLSPLLIGISFALSSYIGSLPFIFKTAENLHLTAPLLAITPFLLTIVAFTLFYVMVPNCWVGLHYAFAGALVAAILFEIAKKLFTLYVAHIPTYSLIYGALATVPIFFVWVYLSWSIILFGAEVSHTLAIRYEGHDLPKLDPFTHAICWLGYFWLVQQQGRGLTLQELIKMDQRNYQQEPEHQLTELLNAQLLQVTPDGHYLLCRDLSAMTVAELYQILPWKLPTSTQLHAYVGHWESALAMILANAEASVEKVLNIPVAKLYQRVEQIS